MLQDSLLSSLNFSAPSALALSSCKKDIHTLAAIKPWQWLQKRTSTMFNQDSHTHNAAYCTGSLEMHSHMSAVQTPFL
jgi:hypothetical protein